MVSEVIFAESSSFVEKFLGHEQALIGKVQPGKIVFRAAADRVQKPVAGIKFQRKRSAGVTFNTCLDDLRRKIVRR